MKKLMIGISMAALAITGALTGTAYAAQGKPAGADKDRTVTRTETQTKATEMFARLDANKDGKLDAADREARRAAMFDRIDTNKDGQISREEFSARQQRPDGAAQGHRMGHRGGKDWAGRGWGGKGGHMMGAADANKDNAVSQAEFTAAALQRFDRMDANKDGQVTKEERQAARAAMRGSRTAPATPAN